MAGFGAAGLGAAREVGNYNCGWVAHDKIGPDSARLGAVWRDKSALGAARQGKLATIIILAGYRMATPDVARSCDARYDWVRHG